MAMLAELDGIVGANNDIGNGNIGGIRWKYTMYRYICEQMLTVASACTVHT